MHSPSLPLLNNMTATHRLKLLISPNSYWEAEVGNVTSKRNGVTCSRFSHALRAIAIKSDNVSYEPRAIALRSDNISYESRVITLRSDNISYEPRAITLRSNHDFQMPWAITIKSDNFSPQCWSICDSQKRNVVLSLCCNAHIDSHFYTSKCILEDSILHLYHFSRILRSQACGTSQVHPRGRQSGRSFKKR